jgi:PAS domain S-box-containing protein
MSTRESRADHWTTSLSHVELLRARFAEVADPEHDDLTRGLMAQVAHEKSSSFIALLDRDGRLLDVNPAALIAGGADRSEVIGLPLWATTWWDGMGHDTMRLLQRSVVAAASGRFTRFDVDVNLLGSPEDRGTMDLILRPLRGRDGQVAFVIAEGLAITDRKRVEQRLERQNAELSALSERLARVHDYRERLLAELSHDLRAPLQVVITRVEQMLRGDPAEEARAQLVSIRVAALGALEQINDMLEQVKADHGQARLALADADLARVVQTVAEQFGPLAAEREVTLEVEALDRLPARFDVERMSRILSNLLANAVRYTPQGGSVLCSLGREDDVAVLSVADTGPGVPAERREKIFGRFVTGAAETGTGLGLAIAREFVELHGGEITVGDAPGGGALFTVRIPLAPADGLRMPATIAMHAAAAQRTEFVRSQLESELAGALPAPPVPTLLIVERVPARAEIIVQGVEQRAVTCVVTDAAEAMRVAVELRPDAVVVGTVYDMPATSFLRRLAADERLIGVHRVALVGEREEDPSAEALVTAGADLVLPAGDAQQLAALVDEFQWPSACDAPDRVRRFTRP